MNLELISIQSDDHRAVNAQTNPTYGTDNRLFLIVAILNAPFVNEKFGD